jgi:aconitase A
MHALALRAAGVRVVLAKSFVPPQRTQLAMAGVLPLTFIEGRDADTVAIGDELELLEMRDRAERREAIVVANRTRGREFQVRLDLDEYEARIALDGGLMRHTHAILHPAPKPAKTAPKKGEARKARPARSAPKKRSRPVRKARHS